MVSEGASGGGVGLGLISAATNQFERFFEVGPGGAGGRGGLWRPTPF